MCSYCGCEAEAVIAGFMADHAEIADLEYRILRALDDQRLDDAAGLTKELSEVFARHSLSEEAGLFAQLRQKGEATAEVDRLVGEHRRLRPALAAEDAVSDLRRLRQLLAELARHAEVEDNDLFPYAIQVLPDDCWAGQTSGSGDETSSPSAGAVPGRVGISEVEGGDEPDSCSVSFQPGLGQDAGNGVAALGGSGWRAG